MKLIKGKVKVEWVDLGEGLSGDYNPDDKKDVPLLRFDVSKLDKNCYCNRVPCTCADTWVLIDDASYCTQVPVNTKKETLKKLLNLLMSEFYEPVTLGHSVKKLGERLSWISPEWATK